MLHCPSTASEACVTCNNGSYCYLTILNQCSLYHTLIQFQQNPRDYQQGPKSQSHRCPLQSASVYPNRLRITPVTPRFPAVDPAMARRALAENDGALAVWRVWRHFSHPGELLTPPSQRLCIQQQPCAGGITAGESINHLCSSGFLQFIFKN